MIKQHIHELGGFPDEILCHILTFLYNPLDIYNFSLTCRRMYSISNDKMEIRDIKKIHDSFENYGFNYPGSLWFLPMLSKPLFINFREQIVKRADIFGQPAIMIEEESKYDDKLCELGNFARHQKHFDHIDKTFPGYSGGRIRIRYYFKIPKKWHNDFKNIKPRQKHNHLKLSKSYRKRILKRYPGINIESY